MRLDGRADDALRPLRFLLDVNRYVEGSCIVEMGHTRVLCTASVSEDLPPWRRASQKGWITAEYRMLPRATHTRGEREGRHDKKGRTAEIERLVGRAPRAAVPLDRIGPRVVTVDCDVLQADGGTRCAAINGGWVALARALRTLGLPAPVTEIAAVSVGVVGGRVVVDLPYEEDSAAEVDMNLVMTGDGRLVEVQGTAEGRPFSPEVMAQMVALGLHARAAIVAEQRAALG